MSIPGAELDDAAPTDGPGAGVVTVLARLRAAGISEDRARAWIASGGVRVDGQEVTDPDHPAAAPARVVLHPA